MDDFLHEIVDGASEIPPSVLFFFMFGGSFFEYVFPPVPGDVWVAGGAILIARGQSFWTVFLGVNLGSLLGFSLDYLFGRWLSHPRRRFRKWGPRWNRLGQGIDRVGGGFLKHPVFYLMVNRFLPGVRAFFFRGRRVWEGPLLESHLLRYGELGRLESSSHRSWLRGGEEPRPALELAVPLQPGGVGSDGGGGGGAAGGGARPVSQRPVSFLLRREVAFPDIIDIASQRLADERAEVEVLAGEAGMVRLDLTFHLAGRLRGGGYGQAQQVAQDQDLAVALRAGSNADGGDSHPPGDHPGDLAGHTLDYQREDAGLLESHRIVDERLGLELRLSLNPVASHGVERLGG